MKPSLALTSAILICSAVPLQKSPATVDYFPVGVFSWECPSSELREMDEPSLWEVSQKSKREVYRFLWLRTFHQPIAVRLTINPDGSGDLVAKLMGGKGGYDTGLLASNEQSHLPPVEARSFIEKLMKADFWTLSPTRFQDSYGRDGAMWIVEGTKNGTYHVVARWSPRDGPYRDACLYLALALARLKIPDREIY
jgi:hypothetical protein